MLELEHVFNSTSARAKVLELQQELKRKEARLQAAEAGAAAASNLLFPCYIEKVRVTLVAPTFCIYFHKYTRPKLHITCYICSLLFKLSKCIEFWAGRFVEAMGNNIHSVQPVNLLRCACVFFSLLPEG